MSLKRFCFALMAVAAICVAGCDGREKSVVGKWKVAGGGDGAVWEFAANKGVDMNGRKGKYSFGDQGRLKVQTQFATFVYQLEMKEDRMVLLEPNGTRLEFERVK